MYLKEIDASKLTKNQLKIKEVIQSGLPFPCAAHLLEMASVLVQGLYNLKCTLCTYHQTVLLDSPTHSYHLFERHHFRLITIRIIPLSVFYQAHLSLYNLYNLSISTFKCRDIPANLSLLPQIHNARSTSGLVTRRGRLLDNVLGFEDTRASISVRCCNLWESVDWVKVNAPSGLVAK